MICTFTIFRSVIIYTKYYTSDTYNIEVKNNQLLNCIRYLYYWLHNKIVKKYVSYLYIYILIYYIAQ